MKELIDGLNLPKQILDKTEKLLNTLFGEGFKEIGGIFGDRMRIKRLENQIKILDKANQIMEKNGLKPNQINLKVLVPLIEKSSLEEDEKLQEKWANLISNISSFPENGLEPKLVKTLSNLSSIEASILDYLHSKFSFKRNSVFEQSKNSFRKYNTIEEVELNRIQLYFKDVKEQFKLTEEFTNMYIDNLESLGLIRNDFPEIEIDNGFSEAEIVENRFDEKKEEIELNLDLTANYSRSEDFYFTSYGLYFINQCKDIETNVT